MLSQMDTMFAQNADEQKSEILALESIYDTDKFATDRTKDGRLRGKITIEVPMTMKMTLTAAVGTKRKTVQVENLSPVYLEFVLPNDYPSSSPPEVSLSAAWLDSSMSAELLKRLNEFWTENVGMPVLYSWSQVVQDEAATLMNATELDLDHIAASQIRSKRRISIDQSLTTASGDGDLPSSSSATLTGEQRLSLICDYDELVRRRQFETGWYQCNVCLSEKSGRHSLEFYPCGHVFCIECVNGYFSVQIKDGAVRQLHCMEDKCKSEATPQQVRLAVPAELYERYERLLLSQTLDLMTDIVVCPRPQCQAPVLLDAPVEVSGANGGRLLPPMATCAQCRFTFCNYCRKVYHGLEPCSFNKNDRGKLLKEYQNGDAETKRQLEARFGKRKLEALVNDFLADEWMGTHSKRCPKCYVNIEKQDGCNKMHCTKCNTLFCWLCMRVLTGPDPYAHFNNPVGTTCFNQLFQGVVMDDDDVDDI